MTPAAVDVHIACLIDRLGLRQSNSCPGIGQAWRKEALATFALRAGLVGPEDLRQPRLAR